MKVHEISTIVADDIDAGVVLPRCGAIEDGKRTAGVTRQGEFKFIDTSADVRGYQVCVAMIGAVDTHVERRVGATVGAFRDVRNRQLVGLTLLDIPLLYRRTRRAGHTTT